MTKQLTVAILASAILIGCNDTSDKAATNQEVKKASIQTTEVKSSTKQTTTKAEQKVQEVKKNITAKIANTTQKDGKTLYVTCKGCHGADASKHALGKSQVIKGWSKEKIVNALKGYQDGTYGSSSKAVMMGQVRNLSNKDIDILASFVSKL